MIPFYGATNPELFSVERRAMDRPGRVTDALRHALPDRGVVIDVGAGDGFTAGLVATGTLLVVPIEPAEGMRRTERRLPWLGGIAQELPLRTQSVDGAYSTWAYFFTGDGCNPKPGLDELHRVVRRGGPIVIVDNLGGDEFTALAPSDIAASRQQWSELGFACTEVATVFEFETEAEAAELLTFYFGPLDLDPVPLTLTYRVGVFTAASTGP